MSVVSRTGPPVCVERSGPRCLDFKIKTGSGALKEGVAYESVYELDGDTLTWVVDLGKAKNRPAGFEKQGCVMIMVLKRVKK